MPVACRVAQAYPANMEVMTMLKEHHSDDWHSAYLGWTVLAIMLIAMVALAIFV